MSLSGFYLYNRTDEPCANYFGTADQNEPNRFADPNDYFLVRRPQILALNNTWVLSNTSVLALRFGMTRFPRQQHAQRRLRSRDARLLADIPEPDHGRKFPQVRIRGYDQFAGADAGRDQPDPDRLEVDERERGLSKFVGAHTFKFGGDLRQDWCGHLHPRQTARASSTSTRT